MIIVIVIMRCGLSVPRHAKTGFRAHADSEGPDQPARPLSDQGLRCPLTESLDTIYNVSMESKCPDENLRMHGINLNLCILRVFEDTLLLGTAHFIVYQCLSHLLCEGRGEVIFERTIIYFADLG